MHQAPTGTVTLVFTDIQGSTVLWDTLGDEFQQALELHNLLVRECLSRHRGYEVKTEGDSFIVAFYNADSAIGFCLDVQRILQNADWPDCLLKQESLNNLCGVSSCGGFRGLRVRMGAYTGTPRCDPDPLTGRMDYFGSVVNRAARISSLAQGGQVLIGETTWASQRSELKNAVVKDLGVHGLNGLRKPEHLRSLVPARMAQRKFAPLGASQERKTNIVERSDSFVGRKSEIEELNAQLLIGSTRLVTLVGAGGSGKTRLASHYASFNLMRFSGGTWFCDLSETHDSDEILRAVGTALGVLLTGNNPDEQLDAYLLSRGSMLLVLDNLEQVIEPARSTIAHWLNRTTQLRILATSRIRLRLPQEQPLFVDPLSVEEALHLFQDRARKQRPDFRITDENRATVIEIVQRLDCMSLAIELAAARLGFLSTLDLLGHLNTRFQLLRDQHQDQSARQATLRNAIDWSWNLLSPWEQLALAQCSVFHGGFTAQDAQQVLDLSAFENAPWTMDVIQSLLDQSLLRRTLPLPGHLRLGLYESIAEYARSQMADPTAIQLEDGRSLTGPNATAERQLAHARWFAAIKTRVSTSHLSEKKMLELDWNNLVAGQQYALSGADSAAICGCTLGANRLLELQGPYLSSIGLLRASVDSVALTPKDRVMLQVELGCVEFALGRDDLALREIRESLAHAEKHSLPREQAHANHHLGRMLIKLGQVDSGVENLEKALALARQHGLEFQEALSLGHLGLRARECGRTEEALDNYEQALALQKKLDNRMSQGPLLGRMAFLHHQCGHPESAIRYYEEALEVHREFNSRRNEGIVLANLASLHLDRGETEAAGELVEQACAIHKDMNDPQPLLAALDRRAEWHRQMRRLGEAEADLLEAQSLAGKGWPMGAGIINSRLGELRLQQESWTEARSFLVEAISLLEESNLLELGRALSLVALLESSTGNREEADAALSAAEVASRKAGATGKSPLGCRIITARETLLGVSVEKLDVD